MMQLTSLAEWNCSVAKTLDVVGEWWTLLILRDAFDGKRRFDDFHASLGMARSVLTARLKKLTDSGVLERSRYSEHPPRYEYELTEAGQELRGVLTALRAWGDRWMVDTPPAAFDHVCGQELDPAIVCRRCGAEVGPGELTVRVLTPGWTRQGPVTA